MRSFLLVLIIFVLAVGNVHSKIYYVSTSGVNTNSGLALSLPWKTITYAASSSSPVVAGDTVYVKAGNYGAEKVVFQKSGTAVKPIAFIGYQTSPGDAPPLIVNNADPYAAFLSTDMPLFDGGNRASGIAFDCRKQKYLVIKNFQIQNYAYGFMAGATTQDAGNLTLNNINIMSLGDVNASYSGQGFLLGSMGTQFSNNNTLTNCMVVNSGAEGFDINGNNNVFTSCKVYCNDNTANAPTDYYMIVTGSYNTFRNCYIERAAGLSHAGHGYTAKTNAEQVVDNGEALPAISAQYNKFYYCIAKNMGESFCVRHRTAQYNLFYHCKAIGTHTGASGSPGGEGNGIVTRDGASDNTFDGCIAENCNSGFVFVDTVEDGDTGTNPPGHPGNNNKYINCLINNCYMGVKFDSYSVQSDAGDNTIANCTFYKARYLHYAQRHCANMKYIGNIYYGCLPTASGGDFKEGTYNADIVPNGTNTYFKNCDFVNIQGGVPAGYVGVNGNIGTDPGFNNPSVLDFHLKSTSPCKDACSIVNITTDFDSLSRPAGTAVDIGAFEYQVISPLAATLVSTNVKCNGENDGSATVTANGGKTPYTYSWNNGQATATASGLSAGNYSVTVSDANLSSKIYTVVITQPLVVALSTSAQVNVKCSGGNDGSATITATGGTSPYTYSWSNGKTTASVIGLVAGSYAVTVYDANVCSKSASISITEPAALVVSNSAQTNVSCNGGNNGTAAVTVSGGKSPYSYSWSNGKTTASLTGLVAGSYAVTVYDANVCSKSVSILITEPAALVVSNSAQTNVSCNGGNDGSATVTVSGGKSPYTYSWSNGKTTASLTGLVAGSYAVTVYDVNACSKSASILITEPAALVISNITHTNVSSNGGNDGSATVTVSGGKIPYTYSWSNGKTTASITGLTAGSYTITVYDVNGCSKVNSVLIGNPSTLVITTNSQTNVSCNGAQDGSVSVTVAGGKAPYDYLWSNGQTTSSAVGLSTGNYSVTVIDANSVSNTFSIFIAEPLALTLTGSVLKNISCNGAADGEVSVAVSGGKSPYTYSWSNGQTASSVSGLTAGSYVVTVYDMNACSKSSVVSITEPAILAVSITAQTNVRCHGWTDGSATVTASGGKGPYTYSWSNGKTTASVSGLAAGDYTVTVYDFNGCSKVSVITITEPVALTLNNSSQKDVTCNGGSNGAADVITAGGDGDYTYLWSPSGQVSTSATGLPAGDHTVTVTDRMGCHVKKTVTISQPAPIVISKLSVTSPTSCISKDGKVIVISSGGTGFYSHHWNTFPPQTSNEARELPPGQYVDTVSDVNGCSIIASATVTCASPTGIITRLKGESELNVFPNPASGPFNITSPVQQVGKPILVVVRDLLGKEFYSKVIVVSNSEEIFTIDPSGALSPGVYLVIATSDDKLYERKIVVQ